MTTLDRTALIEAMARAEHGAGEPEWSWERLVIEEPAWAEGWRANAAAALPVAVRAILAPLREQAAAFKDSVDWSDGRNNYGDNDAYEECARDLSRLLDAIEADLIGDAK